MFDTKNLISPIEVWLTQKNMEVTCMVAYDNEHTDSIEVESLSMRGAQREITGYLLNLGYRAVGRWEYEHEEGVEASRKFVVKPDEKP